MRNASKTRTGANTGNRWRILILDSSEGPGGLAAVRALTREGWVVGVGSPRDGCLASVSRWTAHRHRVPAPSSGLHEFSVALRRLVQTYGYDLVFGTGDDWVLALSATREQLGVLVPYPPHEVVVRLFDKAAATQVAEASGISVPKTAEATDTTLARWSWPAVIKPRSHWTPGSTAGWVQTTVVATAEQAATIASQIRKIGGEPLIQEFVAGKLLSVTMVLDAHREVVAVVQQEAERIWPVSAGGSVRAVSVPVDPPLAALVARFLAELGWVGLAQVQMLQAVGRPPTLIDVNGRFYGSMQLALAAGVNLPALCAELALSGHVDAVGPAHVGVRYTWLERDLHRALVERRKGAWADFTDSLLFARRATHAVADLRDPRPLMREVARATARKLGRSLSRQEQGDPSGIAGRVAS